MLRASGVTGQSLIEILIATVVGVIMVLAATTLIAPALRSNTQVNRIQVAAALGKELLEYVRVFAEADWHGIADLPTSSANRYFLTTPSPFEAVTGTESVVGENFSGLVGHWKLDEATGTSVYDFSGNTNNGTPTATSATSSCQIGDCYSFNGSTAYVSVAYSSSLNVGGGSWTVGAWVKTTQASWGAVVGGYDGYRIILYGASAAGTARVEFNTGSCAAVQAGPQVNDGGWHHIMAARDVAANQLVLYVDGVSVGVNGSCTGTSSATNEALNVGRENRGIEYLNGLIDDVRVYNRGFSSDEVKSLYTAAVYTRYFYVEEVMRDSGGSIVSVGGTNDLSTKKVSVAYYWPQGTTTVVSTYLTRTRNEVFIQTDWSAGPGQDGPVSSTNSRFSTSSNIHYTTTTGSILINL